MKNAKYPTVTTVQKFKEGGPIDTPNTQLHDGSLCWIGEYTSMQSKVGLRLFYEPKSK